MCCHPTGPFSREPFVTDRCARAEDNRSNAATRRRDRRRPARDRLRKHAATGRRCRPARCGTCHGFASPGHSHPRVPAALAGACRGNCRRESRDFCRRIDRAVASPTAFALARRFDARDDAHGRATDPACAGPRLVRPLAARLVAHDPGRSTRLRRRSLTRRATRDRRRRAQGHETLAGSIPT